MEYPQTWLKLEKYTPYNVTTPEEKQKRWRPAKGGVSIGHFKITAGTMSCTVEREGVKFVLSNHHVLAPVNEGKEGEPILQPAPYDKGKDPEDRLAVLKEFVPIEADGKNLVDCALAQPVDPKDVSDEIVDIGFVKGVETAPTKGMKTRKSGRTTCLTEGEIVYPSAVVIVSYGKFRARFEDQIITTKMLEGGDSGSLLLTEDDKAVGLCFAGSESISVANKITHVMEKLNIKFPTPPKRYAPVQAQTKIKVAREARRPAVMGISTDKYEYVEGEEVKVTVNLADKETGEPIVGRRIEFLIDSKPIGSCTTDDKGLCLFRFLAPKPVNAETEFTITAIFKGDPL